MPILNEELQFMSRLTPGQLATYLTPHVVVAEPYPEERPTQEPIVFLGETKPPAWMFEGDWWEYYEYEAPS